MHKKRTELQFRIHSHTHKKNRIEYTRKKLNKVNVSNVDKMKKLESENVRIEQKVQF